MASWLTHFDPQASRSVSSSSSGSTSVSEPSTNAGTVVDSSNSRGGAPSLSARFNSQNQNSRSRSAGRRAAQTLHARISSKQTSLITRLPQFQPSQPSIRQEDVQVGESKSTVIQRRRPPGWSEKPPQVVANAPKTARPPSTNGIPTGPAKSRAARPHSRRDDAGEEARRIATSKAAQHNKFTRAVLERVRSGEGRKDEPAAPAPARHSWDDEEPPDRLALDPGDLAPQDSARRTSAQTGSPATLASRLLDPHPAQERIKSQPPSPALSASPPLKDRIDVRDVSSQSGPPRSTAKRVTPGVASPLSHFKDKLTSSEGDAIASPSHASELGEGESYPDPDVKMKPNRTGVAQTSQPWHTIGSKDCVWGPTVYGKQNPLTWRRVQALSHLTDLFSTSSEALARVCAFGRRNPDVLCTSSEQRKFLRKRASGFCDSQEALQKRGTPHILKLESIRRKQSVTQQRAKLPEDELRRALDVDLELLRDQASAGSGFESNASPKFSFTRKRSASPPQAHLPARLPMHAFASDATKPESASTDTRSDQSVQPPRKRKRISSSAIDDASTGHVTELGPAHRKASKTPGAPIAPAGVADEIDAPMASPSPTSTEARPGVPPPRTPPLPPVTPQMQSVAENDGPGNSTAMGPDGNHEKDMEPAPAAEKDTPPPSMSVPPPITPPLPEGMAELQDADAAPSAESAPSMPDGADDERGSAANAAPGVAEVHPDGAVHGNLVDNLQGQGRCEGLGSLSPSRRSPSAVADGVEPPLVTERAEARPATSQPHPGPGNQLDTGTSPHTSGRDLAMVGASKDAPPSESTGASAFHTPASISQGLGLQLPGSVLADFGLQTLASAGLVIPPHILGKLKQSRPTSEDVGEALRQGRLSSTDFRNSATINRSREAIVDPTPSTAQPAASSPLEKEVDSRQRDVLEQVTHHPDRVGGGMAHSASLSAVSDLSALPSSLPQKETGDHSSPPPRPEKPEARTDHVSPARDHLVIAKTEEEEAQIVDVPRDDDESDSDSDVPLYNLRRGSSEEPLWRVSRTREEIESRAPASNAPSPRNKTMVGPRKVKARLIPPAEGQPKSWPVGLHASFLATLSPCPVGSAKSSEAKVPTLVAMSSRGSVSSLSVGMHEMHSWWQTGNVVNDALALSTTVVGMASSSRQAVGPACAQVTLGFASLAAPNTTSADARVRLKVTDLEPRPHLGGVMAMASMPCRLSDDGGSRLLEFVTGGLEGAIHRWTYGEKGDRTSTTRVHHLHTASIDALTLMPKRGLLMSAAGGRVLGFDLGATQTAFAWSTSDRIAKLQSTYHADLVAGVVLRADFDQVKFWDVRLDPRGSSGSDSETEEGNEARATRAGRIVAKPVLRAGWQASSAPTRLGRLAFHPTRRSLFAIGSEDGVVRLFDLRYTRRHVLEHSVGDAPVAGVSWLHDGRAPIGLDHDATKAQQSSNVSLYALDKHRLTRIPLEIQAAS